MKKIEKIVIVGGGSAGWMSAATMIRAFPKKEIVVIESPDFPVVGVGESTLGGIRVWTNWLGIDEKDFMKHTDATYKYSIKFTDFFEEDSGSFHYPFGVLNTEGTINGTNDWFVKKDMFPEIKNSDFAKTFFPIVEFAEKNKFYNEDKIKINGFYHNRNSAFHFDSISFGQWLKNNYCIPKGVKLISKNVVNATLDEHGIKELFLSDETTISADLFIDCTGFKSILLGEFLNEEWLDYSDMLPNNRAWATRIPYTDKEKEMEPYTNCTAINNGWVWNIPSWKRIGTGYVYSDKYISKEDALKEFKDHLRSEKMTIHNPNRDVDSFEYKDIQFKVGIHKKTFVKNVVAIGLSAGFIEPLESNGLFTTHEFLLVLVNSLRRETITQWDRDAYNYLTKNMFDNFSQFVAQHYALSNRSNSKYWQDINNKVFKKDLHGFQNQFSALADKKLHFGRYKDEEGITCIASGMGYFPVHDELISHWKTIEGVDARIVSTIVFDYWEKEKIKIEKYADDSVSMYKWLKEMVHGEDNE
jgi:flavin-dependent dehydrogenase